MKFLSNISYNECTEKTAKEEINMNFMGNKKEGNNPTVNFRRILEVLILIGIVLLISVGFLLNFKLLFSVDENNDVSLVTIEEQDYLSNLGNEGYETGEALENEYLLKLQDLMKKSKSPNSDEEIAKVYYILALNDYIEKNRLDAIEYYEKSLEIFSKGTNYYYILRAHNNLMNLYFNLNDQISGLKHANEIYVILSRPNLQGISEEDQIALRMNILSGILTVTSTYEMGEMSQKFYDELIEITDSNPEIVGNISIYAKYQHNLNIGNYEEATKFALQYIDYFKSNGLQDIGGAYVYLLEAMIYKGEFDGIEEVFSIVEEAYTSFNSPMYTATLEKLKGYYHKAIGNFEESMIYMEKSIELYESLGMIIHATEVNDKTIALYDDIDFDLHKYLERAERYNEITNTKKEIGELAGALVEVSLKKSDEENAKIKEEAKFTESLNSISKKLNIIYIAVIILLAIIAKLLWTEITKRKEKEEQLENMIKTDYLTKSFSKQYTFSEIEKLIATRQNFSIVLFDIDNFKSINDTYGHAFGDAILINVVQSIKNEFGPDSFIGRFGGEEFIMILNEDEDLDSVPCRIKNALSTLRWNDKNIKITVSGGLKTWNGESINKLICETDILLYQGKSEGKDRIVRKVEF
ncbi:MAG: tetratricopeptide repeat-containing diguanylate cyclase [Clostridium sp.]